ncbi:MAG: hypothetical protein OXG19_09440 [Chloroflexi bacterium]|nr:hypothetical protein [Chloroflexota bacterium]
MRRTSVRVVSNRLHRVRRFRIAVAQGVLVGVGRHTQPALAQCSESGAPLAASLSLT